MKLFSIIIGIQGNYLNDDEENFLKNYPPVGIILFKRNISSIKQVKSLIVDIKKILGERTLVLIDQEGGRVSRLDSKIWPQFPSSEYFGNLAKTNLYNAKKKTYENYFSIGKILNDLGFNYNCAPVLDIRFKNADPIIGNRSFSSDPEIVAALAFQACKGLIDSNIVPILKHIPGHGRANEDSHLNLPHVNSSLAALKKKDFYPFKKLNKFPAVMTAHIKYANLDKKFNTTYSKKIITDIIRKYIGFKGLIFSDDICMKALKENYFNRAKLAINAGCNLVLKCDYNLNTSYNASLGAGVITEDILKKLFN